MVAVCESCSVACSCSVKSPLGSSDLCAASAWCEDRQPDTGTPLLARYVAGCIVRLPS